MPRLNNNYSRKVGRNNFQWEASATNTLTGMTGILMITTNPILLELLNINSMNLTDRIFRHELVHAFFYESGLDTESDFARDEILVDFLAMQIPKLAKLFEKLNLL